MSGSINPFAFPFNEKNDDGSRNFSHAGMTLRDWFAGQSVAGLISVFGGACKQGGETKAVAEGLAEFSYVIADAMLAARAREKCEQPKMQRVAYFDEGSFHWVSGIRPRDCELYAAPVKGGDAC